ncbi:helix-turn-helix domain-containing protein [Tolypothrix sp. VBCCA 56010]|jgi:putative transposase|uniref:helix-turn-helix domain-containing protein n=1 Tax=Tolypothrix sp. VBCCA 56010 TaxID=3137731 RepID=UPI003D7D6C5B|nr:helix-turn-helix domain-containing protein [Spirirestis rafaelensis WJT71-NPBG6]
MPVAYSEDLRSRVIAAWEAKEGSQRQVAQRFKVSLSFVRNLLRHYRTNGQIEAKRRGGNLKPIIQDEQLALVKALVEEKNDLLLSELCDRLMEKTGVRVSVPTMYRAVEKLDLRCKKKLSTLASRKRKE